MSEHIRCRNLRTPLIYSANLYRDPCEYSHKHYTFRKFTSPYISTLIVCVYLHLFFFVAGSENKCIQKQESLAIAKTTARCAQYLGALKSFESPRKRPRLVFPKFVKGFCSDRY